MPNDSSASPMVASSIARAIPRVDAALPGSPRARSCGTNTWSRVASARGRLASSECTGVRPASAVGTTNAPMPWPARATTMTSVVPSAAMMPIFRPVRDHPPSTGSAIKVTSSRDHARGWSASATAPAMAPVATPGQETLLLFCGADLAHHGCELRDRGQEGTGGDSAAKLFHDDGRLQNGEADAAVLLGDGQSGPVEGNHGAPQFLGGLARLDDGAHDVDGAFLLEERADGGTQFFLFTRELELHRTPSPGLAGCLFGAVRHPHGRQQIGASVPDANVSLRCLCYLHAAPFSGKERGWVCPGGSPVRGASPGPATRGACCNGAMLADTEGRSPTLSGGPLAQRQATDS